MHEVGEAEPQVVPLCPFCWLPCQASISLLCSWRAPSAQATEPTTGSWGSSESRASCRVGESSITFRFPPTSLRATEGKDSELPGRRRG